MKEIIRNELMRVFAEMQKLDPKEETYSDLIRKALNLICLHGGLEDKGFGDEQPAIKAEESQAEEPKKEEPKEVGQALTKELEKEDAPSLEPAALTKEVVRAHLQTAADNGIHIQPLIKKYIPEGMTVKFSNVPADKYAELIEELRNAK